MSVRGAFSRWSRPARATPRGLAARLRAVDRGACSHRDDETLAVGADVPARRRRRRGSPGDAAVASAEVAQHRQLGHLCCGRQRRPTAAGGHGAPAPRPARRRGSRRAATRTSGANRWPLGVRGLPDRRSARRPGRAAKDAASGRPSTAQHWSRLALVQTRSARVGVGTGRAPAGSAGRTSSGKQRLDVERRVGAQLDDRSIERRGASHDAPGSVRATSRVRGPGAESACAPTERIRPTRTGCRLGDGRQRHVPTVDVEMALDDSASRPHGPGCSSSTHSRAIWRGAPQRLPGGTAQPGCRRAGQRRLHPLAADPTAAIGWLRALAAAVAASRRRPAGRSGPRRRRRRSAGRPGPGQDQRVLALEEPVAADAARCRVPWPGTPRRR